MISRSDVTIEIRSKDRPRGIPTTYRRTRFRSRLEARWAAFFDLIGWTWTYEPFDADGWIPDFLIEGPAPFLVEVGPCVIARDYVEKAEDGAAGHRQIPTLIAGTTPLTMWRYDPWSEPLAGLFINEFPDSQPFSDGVAFWVVDTQGRLHIYSDGDFAYPGRIGWEAPSWEHADRTTLAHLRDLWADAGNQVQWRR